MSRRREPVPFTFPSEVDAFRSNVAPPPRARASAGQIAGRILVGLTLMAGLVGSLVVGMPALTVHPGPDHSEQSQPSRSR